MTREELKKKYCKKLRITEKSFDKGYKIMTCSCNNDECLGLVVIDNNKENIKRHERMEELRKKVFYKR